MAMAAAEERAEAAAPRATGLVLELLAIRVLWARDLTRFFRQRSRVIGALVQPLIFWLVIGGGLAGSFRMPSAPGVGYVEYFFPGVVLLVVLFTAIFTTMSVIEDRHRGFLQAVLVAPASRASLVLGKTLGSVTIALAQAALFLALLPLAGYSLAEVDWPRLVLVLTALGVALASVGFALAWLVDSTQGYHVVMNVLLLPLWILSGAMFPLDGAPGWMGAVMRANPLAYGVSALRRALYGARFPDAVPGAGPGGPLVELVVVTGFALMALALAVAVCNRRNKP